MRIVLTQNRVMRRIGNAFDAFSELNWYNYTKNASAFALPVEGGDLFNLGSPGVRGNNLVTSTWGLKVKPNRNIGAAVDERRSNGRQCPATQVLRVRRSRFAGLVWIDTYE